MGETEDNISPDDHLVLVSLYVLVIIGEHIQRSKNPELKLKQRVKTKVSNAN